MKYEKEAEKERQQESERSFQEFLNNKGTWKRPPPSPTLTQRYRTILETQPMSN